MTANSMARAQQIWVEASAERIGLGLVVSDPRRAKTQLYSARKLLISKGHTHLASFVIRTSPEEPACQLWLIRIPDGENTTDTPFEAAPT